MLARRFMTRSASSAPARMREMDRRTEHAAILMDRFADRTGLTSSGSSTRYLWTDAFAVCNFLALERRTGAPRYRDLARALVDRVHDELGRHRSDDSRSGWISGKSDAEGRAHPTCGGLRIGKRLPERQRDEPFDAELEWDRDGQYFHYLTKWMHALDQVARATGEIAFHRWAHELAGVAHGAFTRGPRTRRRMVWKMSIDLSRPLVPSMGQHDPLDGLVTCLAMRSTSTALRNVEAEPDLDVAIDDFASMVDVNALDTHDPLGVGGLLVDAYRLAQITSSPALVEALLAAAARGLRLFAATSDLRAPAHRRLAFRELGLAIGLSGASMLEKHAAVDARIAESVHELAQWQPMREQIEEFWSDEPHRRVSAWTDHQDINDVMLATALVPEGFLVLGPSGA